jgi:hypothetical protein
MQQVAVDWADQRLPVSGHRCKDEEAHAMKSSGELLRAEATSFGDDAAQMGTSCCRTFVKESLQSS